MKVLHDYFVAYDNDNRLLQSDYDKIRDKRDIILDELRKSEIVPVSFSSIVLGSAKLHTGVKYEDRNYDIDCGIRLNIKKDEMQKYTAKACKDSVFEEMKKYRDPKYKTKCVTAVYYRDDEPLFHIDFPVFAYDQEDESYYLADGKANEGVEWKEAFPEQLINYLDKQDDDYRRIIRLLKLWNYHAFKNEKKDAKAPSVALSLETRDWFESNAFADDLSALISITEKLKSRINVNSIYMKNPFEDNNIFYKMDGGDGCVAIFAEKLDTFISTLKKAKEASKTSVYNACDLLKKVFPGFPQPEKEKARESFGNNARYA